MSSVHTEWARSLPRGEYRTKLIECFVGMCEGAGGDNFTAHAMFVRKVLREPWPVAFQIAHRFRRNTITVEGCELLADEWHEEAPRVLS